MLAALLVLSLLVVPVLIASKAVVEVEFSTLQPISVNAQLEQFMMFQFLVVLNVPTYNSITITLKDANIVHLLLLFFTTGIVLLALTVLIMMLLNLDVLLVPTLMFIILYLEIANAPPILHINQMEDVFLVSHLASGMVLAASLVQIIKFTTV